MDLEVEAACRHDIDDIANLALEVMPDMTHLYPDAASWRTSYRFGTGQTLLDNTFLVVRGPTEAAPNSLFGFVWADNAPRIDYGITEPWWCITAVAVNPKVQGKGLGRALVQQVIERAASLGVTAIYGICYASSAEFWKRCGFTLTEKGQAITSTKEVRLPDGREGMWVPSPPEDQHMFTLDLVRDGSANVLIPDPEQLPK